MKNPIIVALFTASIAGCAVRSDLVTGPDGSEAIAMRCKNSVICFKEAGERCPKGYERLDEQTTVRGGGSFKGYGGGVKTGASMLIKCRS